MVIQTKELVISEKLKNKVEIICKFACIKYQLINGNVINIKSPILPNYLMNVMIYL